MNNFSDTEYFKYLLDELDKYYVNNSNIDINEAEDVLHIPLKDYNENNEKNNYLKVLQKDHINSLCKIVNNPSNVFDVSLLNNKIIEFKNKIIRNELDNTLLLNERTEYLDNEHKKIDKVKDIINYKVYKKLLKESKFCFNNYFDKYSYNSYKNIVKKNNKFTLLKSESTLNLSISNNNKEISQNNNILKTNDISQNYYDIKNNEIEKKFNNSNNSYCKDKDNLQSILINLIEELKSNSFNNYNILNYNYSLKFKRFFDNISYTKLIKYNKRCITLILDIDHTILFADPVGITDTEKLKEHDKLTEDINSSLLINKEKYKNTLINSSLVFPIKFFFNNMFYKFLIYFRKGYIDVIKELAPYCIDIKISTAGVYEYAKEIVFLLNNYLLKDIFEIRDFASSKENYIINKNIHIYNKRLDFFNLNIKDAIIFDDTIRAWVKGDDIKCIIPSYKFINIKERNLIDLNTKKKNKSGPLINNYSNVLDINNKSKIINKILEFPFQSLLDNDKENKYGVSDYNYTYYSKYMSPVNFETNYTCKELKQDIYIKQIIYKIIYVKQVIDSNIATFDLINGFRSVIFTGYYVSLYFYKENSYMLTKILISGGAKITLEKDKNCTHFIFDNNNIKEAKKYVMELNETNSSHISTKDNNKLQLIYCVNFIWIIKSTFCLIALDENIDEFNSLIY